MSYSGARERRGVLGRSRLVFLSLSYLRAVKSGQTLRWPNHISAYPETIFPCSLWDIWQWSAERKEKHIVWSEEKHCALPWWCLSDGRSEVSLVDTLCLHWYLTASHAGCKELYWMTRFLPYEPTPSLQQHCHIPDMSVCRQLQSGASVRCHSTKPMDPRSL